MRNRITFSRISKWMKTDVTTIGPDVPLVVIVVALIIGYNLYTWVKAGTPL